MITVGFTTIDPFTQTRTVVMEGDEERQGTGWVLEVHCPPGAAAHILEHVHLSWTETFEIVSGEAWYGLDGSQRSASAGETVEVAAGHTHVHPWNAGDTELVYRQINVFGAPSREAVQDVLGAFATLNGLAREGKVGQNGLPKNPLQFAATMRTLVKHEGFDARVPIPVQRVMAATLGRLAESMGYRSSYPRYLSGPSS